MTWSAIFRLVVMFLTFALCVADDWTKTVIIILLIDVVLIDADRCYVPREFRDKKYLLWIKGQDATQVEFKQSTIVTHTANGISNEACEDSDQNGRRTYLMTATHCFELVMLDSENGVLFKKEDKYSDDVTQCQAITGNSMENRLLPNVAEIRATKKCPFLDGKYQATFINEQGVRDCIGDMDSYVTIEDVKMTFHVCKGAFTESVTRPRQHAFRCGGSIEGNFVDSDKNGRVLMLHGECASWQNCFLYCSRYTMSGDVVDMSIVVHPYPNDGTKQAICFSMFSSATANLKTYAVRLTDLTDRPPKVTKVKTTSKPRKKDTADGSSEWPVPPYMLFTLIPAFVLLVVVAVACSRFNRRRNAAQQEWYPTDEMDEYGYNYNMNAAYQQIAERKGFMKSRKHAQYVPPSESSNQNMHNKNRNTRNEGDITANRWSPGIVAYQRPVTEQRHDTWSTNHNSQRSRPLKRLDAYRHHSARANYTASSRDRGNMMTSAITTTLPGVNTNEKEATTMTTATPLLKANRRSGISERL